MIFQHDVLEELKKSTKSFIVLFVTVFKMKQNSLCNCELKTLVLWCD